jgi:DNA-binding GntR family transcriptional regulator
LLLEALERRDPHDAERLLQTHIRRTRLTLDEHLELFDS